MYQAYSNIFAAYWARVSGLFEADSGAIGGSGSTEFMVLAEAGEDEVLYTEDGRYAANVEKAVSLPPEAEPSPVYRLSKAKRPPNTATIARYGGIF